MKRFLMLALGALFCVVLSGPIAFGAAIYDNGAPDSYSFGSVLTYVTSVDDFSVSQNSVINGATIGVAIAPGGPLSSAVVWDNSLEWGVFSSENFSPNTLLASGYASNQVITDITIPDGPDFLHTLSFDFGSDVYVSSATQYWFGVHALNVTSSPNGLSWLYTDIVGSTSASIHLLGQNILSTTNFLASETINPELYSSAYRHNDQMFSLNGEPAPVPEPATMLLLGGGLAGLALYNRRRKSA